MRPAHPKADPDNAGHVGAPMPGKVSSVAVAVDQVITKGAKLLSIEAMKMETAVYAPRDGKVARLHVQPGTAILAGDLLVEIV